MVVSRIKQVAYLLIAAFLIYAIFKSPDQAAAFIAELRTSGRYQVDTY